MRKIYLFLLWVLIVVLLVNCILTENSNDKKVGPSYAEDGIVDHSIIGSWRGTREYTISGDEYTRTYYYNIGSNGYIAGGDFEPHSNYITITDELDSAKSTYEIRGENHLAISHYGYTWDRNHLIGLRQRAIRFEFNKDSTAFSLQNGEWFYKLKNEDWYYQETEMSWSGERVLLKERYRIKGDSLEHIRYLIKEHKTDTSYISNPLENIEGRLLFDRNQALWEADLVGDTLFITEFLGVDLLKN